MGKQITLDVAGQAAIFHSTYTPLAVLEELCERHNLASTFRGFAAKGGLFRALKTLYQVGSGGTARVDEGKDDTYCVVLINRDEAGNKYRTTLRFAIDDEDWTVKVLSGKVDPSPVQSEVNRLRVLCKTGNVTNGLGKLVMRDFGGTRLTLGSYFVNASRLDDWNKFVEDYEKVTNGNIRPATMVCDAGTVSTIMATASTDLESRYRDSLDRLAKIGDEDKNDTPTVAKSKVRRRKKIMAELDGIKKLAAQIDKSCGQTDTLTKEIADSIEAEMAMALLAVGA